MLIKSLNAILFPILGSFLFNSCSGTSTDTENILSGNEQKLSNLAQIESSSSLGTLSSNVDSYSGSLDPSSSSNTSLPLSSGEFSLSSVRLESSSTVSLPTHSSDEKESLVVHESLGDVLFSSGEYHLTYDTNCRKTLIIQGSSSEGGCDVKVGNINLSDIETMEFPISTKVVLLSKQCHLSCR